MTGDHQALANTLALLGWEPRRYVLSKIRVLVNPNCTHQGYVDCMWPRNDGQVMGGPQMGDSLYASTGPMPWDEFGVRQLRLFLIKAQQP